MRQNRQLNQLANRFLVAPDGTTSTTSTTAPPPGPSGSGSRTSGTNGETGLGEMYEAWGKFSNPPPAPLRIPHINVIQFRLSCKCIHYLYQLKSYLYSLYNLLYVKLIYIEIIIYIQCINNI